MSLELKDIYELKDLFYVVGIVATFLISLGNIVYNIHINRRTTYINSVTTERVKWINALRENISKYAGLTYNWVISDVEEGSDESKEILKDIDQVRILIQLQLNPSEELSQKIISWIDQISQHTYESQKEQLKVDLKQKFKGHPIIRHQISSLLNCPKLH